MNAQGIPLLVARLLIALMFIGAGISKFTGLDGAAGYIGSVGLPAPQLLAVAAGALELIAGVLLVIGWQARWAALALAGFTLVASFIFHAYWNLPSAEQRMPMLLFTKNMAIIGGLLFVFAFGPGRISLDARRAAA